MTNTKTGADVYSVSRLNREVRAVLEGSFPTLWVKGEMSNLARPASGHWYFSLKDANSQVRCAMFKGRNRFIKFQPENGDEVLLQVNVGLYEGRGEFQLIVEQMEPAGEGALQRAFEQLKQKLFREGLFAEEHKKPLPKYPKQIGVITSPTGAAIRDILSVLKRRYPLADVIVYPVPVQGEAATEEICKMLKQVEQRNEVDVIILARGGGSIEDLWAFNDETLARLIFKCSIPIVSGIGHEIDFTIADFVADYRAATPSAAAEIVCQEFDQIKNIIKQRQNNLTTLMREQIRELAQTLDFFYGKLFSPLEKIQKYNLEFEYLKKRMLNNWQQKLMHDGLRLKQIKESIIRISPVSSLETKRETTFHLFKQLINIYEQKKEKNMGKLKYLVHSLDLVSPLAVLNRGYTITRRLTDNSVIHTIKDLNSGDEIDILFPDGNATAEIKGVR